MKVFLQASAKPAQTSLFSCTHLCPLYSEGRAETVHVTALLQPYEILAASTLSHCILQVRVVSQAVHFSIQHVDHFLVASI